MVGDAETQVWEGFFEAMEHNFKSAMKKHFRQVRRDICSAYSRDVVLLT